jgi:hypothetical protein
MDLTVVIVPLPNQGGYSARLAAPIELSAEGPTADEAQERLAVLLDEKLRSGIELRTLHVVPHRGPSPGGWLPDDELTQEWLQHMKDYRAECDAEDEARILGDDAPGESPP